MSFFFRKSGEERPFFGLFSWRIIMGSTPLTGGRNGHLQPLTEELRFFGSSPRWIGWGLLVFVVLVPV
jgi:hypothetical protein